MVVLCSVHIRGFTVGLKNGRREELTTLITVYYFQVFSSPLRTLIYTNDFVVLQDFLVIPY